MTTTLISMVGHQPLPNLLAIRYLQPDQVLFLYSATGDVVQRKHNLTELLPPGCREFQIPPVDPWDIRSIPATLPEIIRRRRLDETTLIFDLTGGTKAMAIGLTQVAKQHQQATLIYVDSERTSSTLYQYRFGDGDRLERDEGTQLPDLLTLDMFFHAYQGRFDTSPKSTAQEDERGQRFEEDVARTFAGLRNVEIMRSVRPVAAEEIDIVIRYRNRVAIVECKTGNKARKLDGVMQLSNLASERYLGTYTSKILAVATDYRALPNNMEAANRHNVFVLELPDWEKRSRDESGRVRWSSTEVEGFQRALEFAFGPETRG